MQQEIASFTLDTLRRMMQNFKELLQECIEKRGDHLASLIFKKNCLQLFGYQHILF